MRTTRDLIAELEQESKKHWLVMMAIGFDHSTIFVRAKDADRLATLNSAIPEGGIPVGLIAADKTRNEITMQVRVFPEHDERSGAVGYLTALLIDRVRETLEGGRI